MGLQFAKSGQLVPDRYKRKAGEDVKLILRSLLERLRSLTRRKGS